MKLVEHEMTITPIGRGSLHTGRGLYRVVCITCKKVVHERTNGPDIRIRDHLARCLDCGVIAGEGVYGYIGCGCPS